MKNALKFKVLAFFVSIIFISEKGQSQGKLVLNSAKINITNGANLVLANPAADAIIRQNGHIISEGENNLVKWNMANNTGTYTIPFGLGNSDYLPLSFSKSTGSGTGYFIFSTYKTTWQNSIKLPTGVTNLNSGNQDNSAFVLDRFWQISGKNYITLPNLTDVNLTYLENELSDEHNFINESDLGLQGWNSQTNSWSDFLSLGQVDANNNKLIVSSFPTDGAYKWWTLVDKSSPLPLNFISFEARKTGSNVNLTWVTANEINCKNFEIQRSGDGHTFTTIDSKTAVNGSLNKYTYQDFNPLSGILYYRLKQVDTDGKYKYTPIRSVNNLPLPEFTIYPNPTNEHRVKLSLRNSFSDNCSIVLVDLNGKLICSFEKETNQNSIQLEFPESVKPGMYFLKIFNNNYSMQSKLLIN